MLRRLCFLFLTGCLTNNSLSTLSDSQENIWNLSRLSIGMCENEVLKVMDKPYKTQMLDCEDKKYVVWFYVTKASGLGQRRLVRQNVTPLTFYDGVLQGWGFEVYDKITQTKSRALEQSSKSSHEDKRIEKVIQELQKKPEIPQKTSQNQSLSNSSKTKKSSTKDSKESEPEEKKPENSPVDVEDEKMIDDQNDENFNFW